MADQTSRFGLNMPTEDEYVNASRALYNNNFEAIDALLGAPARETAPLNPGSGQIYSVPSTKRLKIYLNGVWEDIRVVGDVLGSAEIPNLNASKITAGTLNSARIPNLDASKITAGVLNTARIPNLSASKITSGTLNINRIPGIPSSKLIAPLSTPLDMGSGSSRTILSPGLLRIYNTDLTYGSLEASTTFAVLSNNELILHGSNGAVLRTAAGGIQISNSTGRLNSTPTYDNTTGNSANVWVSSGGWFARSTSSRRYKKNIEDAPILRRVLEIQPRTWEPLEKSEEDNDDITERIYGAVAEELADLELEELITRNEEGEPESINYDRIAVALIPIIREMDDRLKRVEEAIEKMYDYDD